MVIVGDRGGPSTTALFDEAWRTSLPGRTMTIVADGATLPPGHPAKGKIRIDGQPTAYVCVGTFCSLPVTTLAALTRTMRDIRRTAGATAARGPASGG